MAPPPRFRCPACRYDLTGQVDGLERSGGTVRAETPLTCPECGSTATLAAAADTTDEQGRGPVYFLLWVVSAIMLLGGCGCGLTTLAYVAMNAFGGSP